MPELPEVETTRVGISPYLINNIISSIAVRNGKLRWPVDPILSQLKQQPIISVQRRAKYILIELATGWIMVHLGMSGRLRILKNPVAPEKHDHIDINFVDGTLLRYTDPRRFGSWLWLEDLNQCKLLQQLGPEPLSDDFTLDWLLQKAQGRKIAVKKWIMDNKVVVGVGNIYANEALFKASIHPERLVETLSAKELARLRLEVIAVLNAAILQGGTTLRDFLGSDGKPGYFVQQLAVYGRAGEACLHCGTLLKSKVIGQRNSFYCETCQR